MRFAQVPPGGGGVPFCISGENAVRSKEFFSRCRSDCFCLPAGIVAAHWLFFFGNCDVMQRVGFAMSLSPTF